MASSEVRGTGHVQSVDRAVDLLEALSRAEGSETTVPALARACGLNRATAWRLLATLRGRGLVVLDDSTGRYGIGPGLVALVGGVGASTLVERSRPILESLSRRSGETAALAIPGLTGLAYVDEVMPSSVVAASWCGRAVPIHATSTGKALLAALPEAEAQRMLSAELSRHTSTTITDPAALAEELHASRERGYSTCYGELESSLFGVSAAITDAQDRPVGVLSIWGPSDRLTSDRFSELGQMVAASALELSE